MGVSKAIHASHKPNKQGIYTIIYKHPKHAINDKHGKHANINKELGIVTKT